MFSRQHSCCFICKEKLQTVRVTRPNTQRGLTSSVLSTQSAVEGQKTHANNMHSPKNTHPQSTMTKLQYTHTHTQPISYFLADTHTATQTHASITGSFFPSSTKITLSHRRSRYVYSTRRISLTARLAHATLILERWLFWWQLACLT